jgi:hypothetical protein
METNCKEEAYDEVLSFLSTLESENERDENLDRDTVFWKGMQYARKQMIEEAVEVFPCFDKRRRLTGFSIDPEADGTNGWSCRIILCKIK